jgi:DNA (cytosine-5)-methyltransferase 1
MVHCLNDQGGKVMDVSEEKTGTLRAEAHGHAPIVQTIAIEGNGARPSHKGNGYKETDKMYTLNTTEVHGVAYSMGHDERSAQFTPNKTDPLTASDYKQPPIVGQPKIAGTLSATFYKGAGNNSVDASLIPDVKHKTVRRLTPLECERLQGLPDEECFVLLDLKNEKVVFIRWLEYQKSPAQYAEDKCHKKQRFVGIVEKSKLLENALFVERNIHSSNQKTNKPVRFNVPINLEDNEQEKLNLWERLRNVFNAEKISKSLLQNQTTNFVQSNVPMNIEKENIARNGEMVQQNKEKVKKEGKFGISALEQFGNEIRALAKDVAKPIQVMEQNSQFTILDLTEIVQIQGMLPKILSFFAQNVITMFTLKQEQIVAISLGIKGYTDIEFNGKPAPDSKRYKAIGNGMAVPCSDFIMRRIAEVNNE